MIGTITGMDRQFNNGLFSFSVDTVTWDQLIALFPLLVDCTTTTSVEVSRSLREALIQYGDLLRPPTSNHNEINGVSLQNHEYD